MNIKFLETTIANDEGDITPVIEETERHVYYYDGWERWSYLPKNLDGEVFEYTEEEANYEIPEK